MKRNGLVTLVLVTAPDRRVARRLAQGALKAKLIACANLVPVESHYWWQGKIENGPEVLLVLKTVAKRLEALEKFVVTRHPYDTPEFLVVPVKRGNRRYLDWLSNSVRSRE